MLTIVKVVFYHSGESSKSGVSVEMIVLDERISLQRLLYSASCLVTCMPEGYCDLITRLLFPATAGLDNPPLCVLLP